MNGGDRTKWLQRGAAVGILVGASAGLVFLAREDAPAPAPALPKQDQVSGVSGSPVGPVPVRDHAPRGGQPPPLPARDGATGASLGGDAPVAALQGAPEHRASLEHLDARLRLHSEDSAAAAVVVADLGALLARAGELDLRAWLASAGQGEHAQNVLLALGLSGREDARALLLEQLGNPSSSAELRLTAALALAQESDPELRRLLESPGLREDGPLAHVRLGPIRDAELRRSLAEALNDPSRDGKERVALAAALGPSQADGRVASALRGAYRGGEQALRAQVVTELAGSDDPLSQRLLEQAVLSDPDSGVRVSAAFAVGAEGEGEATLDWVAKTFWASADPTVQRALLLRATEWAGTASGAAFLADVLRNSEDPALWTQAVAALAVSARADPVALRAAVPAGLASVLTALASDVTFAGQVDARLTLDALRG